MTASAPSASARVVKSIVRGLYEGEYAPGQRLAEPELMAQFGVSRSTARESIRRMESEGIVTVLPHRGAVIRRMTTAEALDALMVMELCVGLAARQAAERIDASGGRARFQQTWRELQTYRDRPGGYEFIAARNRFYRVITELSGNSELRRIVPSIHVHLIRRDYSPTLHERFQDYARMAEAVLAGDGPAAETAARRHIARIAALVRQRAVSGDNAARAQEGV
ncbi:MAG: GntR family transcriptional regulator [Pseudomonadota bacterium]|nr:GntR family transcriptional regulator [Pseudomonadota bacterium]